MAPASATRASSAISLVLPDPASPHTTTTWGLRSRTTRRHCASRKASSSSRPTSAGAGAPGWRWTGCSDTASHTSTGSCLPLSSTGWRARNAIRPPVSSVVRRPHSTSPGPAAFSRRAATLTVSPMTVIPPPAPTAFAITSPEFTPMEKTRSPPRCRMAMAAATALSASSSWARGTPNTAMTESPMYLSTVPPCWATMAPSSRKAVSTSRATTSGSVRSAREVKPTTSAKRTVASLRSSTPVGAARGEVPFRPAPHRPQNRWPSVTVAPHDGHPSTGSAAPHPPQKRYPSGLEAPHAGHRSTCSRYLARGRTESAAAPPRGYSGLWHTASTLFPSGSRTKAP